MGVLEFAKMLKYEAEHKVMEINGILTLVFSFSKHQEVRWRPSALSTIENAAAQLQICYPS